MVARSLYNFAALDCTGNPDRPSFHFSTVGAVPDLFELTRRFSAAANPPPNHPNIKEWTMRFANKHLRQLEKIMEKLRSGAPRPEQKGGVSRRNFLELTALAGAGASLAGAATMAAPAPAQAQTSSAPTTFNEATIAQLQAAMASGQTSSLELTNFYINRILALDQRGPGLNSVIEINPDATAMAQSADTLRKQGRVLSPLQGIPVLLKDNIDTGDKMQTTAGSFALAGQSAVRDSTVAGKLRAGGAVLLGKANLSEWANFRSFFSSSGWSGRGGQCNNPYAIDRNPCGSSSGSGAATSGNLTMVALATETDGSIVCPANNNGIVGIKPTVGLTSRAGVVPISHTQDTVGPHARTVADAAAVLSVIASQKFDGRDPATGGVPLGLQGVSTRPKLPSDYTQFVNINGLSGARIGVTRQGIDGASPSTAAVFDNALGAMTAAGATLVDLDAAGFVFPPGDGEFLVLLFDFKIDLQNYFATRVGVPMAGKTLQDAIDFNNANAATEMPFFGQEIFILAEAIDTSSPDAPQPLFGGLTYNQALAIDQAAGATNGIDLALSEFNISAIVTPTGAPAWTTDLINADHFVFGTSQLAAIVGYPIINVPMGNVLGLPVGISFIGTGFSEPTLIKLASGFEHATNARIVPQFFSTLPLNTSGIPLTRRQSSPGRNKPHSL
jgi:amidase